MDPRKRALVNTLAQNIRTLANIVLSFYSTRIVLSALGTSDYGTFSLVAGIVAMLGFITNAMVITTQRHLAFEYGNGDLNSVRQIFANSYFLHIVLGLSLVVILFCITPFLFSSGFLHINPLQKDEAEYTYFLMTIVLFISFVTAPFRALFVARENIIYISAIDIMDGVLKLALSFSLFLFSNQRLIIYACVLLLIMVFNFLTQAIYAKIHYEECSILPAIHLIRIPILKKIFGFAGWTFYSMGCIIARTQGLSIILNRVSGTLANASYGIAMQVVGAAQFLGQAILNALSPQIIKAEGKGNHTTMLQLSELTSKYATFLVTTAIIPLVWEMPELLRFWLGQVPPHSVFFCRMMLIASACDQLTIGLGTANQATGQIRTYSLVVNTIKLFTLPAACLCLHFNLNINSVMWCYLTFELLCALIRIPFLHHTAGLSIKSFLDNVLLRLPIPIATLFLTGLLCTSIFNFPYRFILTLFVSIAMEAISVWFWGIKQGEREALTYIIQSSIHKNHVNKA